MHHQANNSAPNYYKFPELCILLEIIALFTNPITGNLENEAINQRTCICIQRTSVKHIKQKLYHMHSLCQWCFERSQPPPHTWSLETNWSQGYKFDPSASLRCELSSALGNIREPWLVWCMKMKQISWLDWQLQQQSWQSQKQAKKSHLFVHKYKTFKMTHYCKEN